MLETTDYHYKRNSNVINGLPNYYLDVREHISVSSSQFCFDSGPSSVDTKREVGFKNFTPGTVVALRWAFGHGRVRSGQGKLEKSGKIPKTFSSH